MIKIGKRFTKPRKAIFQALTNFKKPVTAKEIYHFLKNSIDLASIYRTLDLMKQLTIVNEIEFGDGKKRYELVTGKNHHHHLVCESCGDVMDVEMKEEKLLNKIKTKNDFKIKRHELEFFGLCQNCQ